MSSQSFTCGREQHDVLHARGRSRRQQRAQAARADDRAHAPQRGRHRALVACRAAAPCVGNFIIRPVYERDDADLRRDIPSQGWSTFFKSQSSHNLKDHGISANWAFAHGEFLDATLALIFTINLAILPGAENQTYMLMQQELRHSSLRWQAPLWLLLFQARQRVTGRQLRTSAWRTHMALHRCHVLAERRARRCGVARQQAHLLPGRQQPCCQSCVSIRHALPPYAHATGLLEPQPEDSM